MAAVAVVAVAIADQEVAARLRLQEEAEVLGAHRRPELEHVLRTGQLAEHAADEVRFGHVIDGGRVLAPEFEFALRLECGAGRFGDRPHAPLDQVQHLVA